MKLPRKIKLNLGDLPLGETPMLVPSFSSRANVNLTKTIDTVRESINGPILLSAYDVYWAKLRPVKFPQLIFLDSGGYERSRDNDVSLLGFYKPSTRRWTRGMHKKCIEKWEKIPPTVVVSYDAPSIRESIQTQIKRAEDLFKEVKGVSREILVKPEAGKTKTVNLEAMKTNLEKLAQFDFLGITEKELGDSVLDRMVAIAEIRLAMEKFGIEQPIHVFGSLDPITTPLYYIAGADVFDGLSWLRFIIHKGAVYYADSYGPRKNGIHTNINQTWGLMLASNLSYVTRLELNLRKFQPGEEYRHLGADADFFRNAREDLVGRIGRVI
jgi:hypothetical protein